MRAGVQRGEGAPAPLRAADAAASALPWRAPRSGGPDINHPAAARPAGRTDQLPRGRTDGQRESPDLQGR